MKKISNLPPNARRVQRLFPKDTLEKLNGRDKKFVEGMRDKPGDWGYLETMLIKRIARTAKNM